MEALVYNISTGNIDYSCLSFALRSSYLFIDQVAAAGELGMNILIDELYRDISAKEKIYLIESWSTRHNNTDVLEQLTPIKNVYKKHQQVKHPPAKLIVSFKKVERYLNLLYDEYLKMLIDSSVKNGMLELKGIVEQDVFGFCQIDNLERGESSKKPSQFMAASEALQSVFAAKEGEDVLMTLTGEFFNPAFLQNRKIYKPADEEALQEQNIYLCQCLKFPMLNILKSVELKALRNKIFPEAITFNKKMDQWINTKNNSPKERVEYFIQQILPLIPAIQQTIDENELLQHTYEVQKEMEMDVEIWIGEAPLPIIWEYYKYYKVSNETTCNALQAALEKKPELNKRIPFMVVIVSGKGKEKYNATPKEIEILTARKTISID